MSTTHGMGLRVLGWGAASIVSGDVA
jgi:hypothetical protein